VARLYIISDHVQLGAGGTGTIELEAPGQKTLKGHVIVQESDGDYRITDIKNKAGESLIKGELHGTQLQDLRNFTLPGDILTIPKADSWTFYLEDLSGATNDIWIGIVGEQA